MSLASPPQPEIASNAAASPAGDADRSVKVAYVVSRFPKLTETFVLLELLAVEKQGVQVELFPLMRAKASARHAEGASVFRKFCELFSRSQAAPLMHAEAGPVVERAHYVSWFAFSLLIAQWQFLWKSPKAYLGSLCSIIWHNWGSLNFLLGGLMLFPKAVYFARRAEQLGITHLHAHFANHATTVTYVISRLTGIPFSFTAHGSDIQVDQHMLKAKVAAALLVVTVSDANRTFLLDYCGKKHANRIRVIRCGVDTQHFQPQARSQNGQTFEIACVGTLYEVKGQRYLLDACGKLKEQNIDFRCHLVGDGEMRDELVAKAEALGIAKQIIFHGKLLRDDLARLLADVDVLCTPSVVAADGRKEGIPVVLMEAMSAGIPVVASEVSGIPELVRHEETGLLVPPRDSVAITDALIRLQGDKALRQRLSRTGRTEILRNYDQHTNAEKLISLFRQQEVIT